MDVKNLSIKQAVEFVRQLEREGIDCPNCNKKVSLANSQCPNCSYVFSKRLPLAVVAIVAGLVALIVLYLIGFF
jgi:uncharacterized paraquat-inducible protein A